MGELGEDENSFHYEVGTHAEHRQLICYSVLEHYPKLAEGAKKQNPALTVNTMQTREEMTEELYRKEGDAVLLRHPIFGIRKWWQH